MLYAKFDWVVSYAFGGWHHVGLRKTFQGAVSFSVWGNLATYDFNHLTKLVLAAHAAFVRVEITQSGPGMVKIWLTERAPKTEGDDFSQRHPSLQDLTAEAKRLEELT